MERLDLAPKAFGLRGSLDFARNDKVKTLQLKDCANALNRS